MRPSLANGTPSMSTLSQPPQKPNLADLGLPCYYVTFDRLRSTFSALFLLNLGFSLLEGERLRTQASPPPDCPPRNRPPSSPPLYDVGFRGGAKPQGVLRPATIFRRLRPTTAPFRVFTNFFRPCGHLHPLSPTAEPSTQATTKYIYVRIRSQPRSPVPTSAQATTYGTMAPGRKARAGGLLQRLPLNGANQ